MAYHSANLSGTQILSMVTHWLNTPVNGYLGSSYGADTKALLQKPNQPGLADAFIAKMRRDIPVLGLLSPGQINIYAVGVGSDALRMVINVAGTDFEIRA